MDNRLLAALRTTTKCATLIAVWSSIAIGPAAAQFYRMHFDPANGRVGYHMEVLAPLMPADDLPRGNTGGAFSGTCRANVGGADQPAYAPTVAGALPPGIEMVGFQGHAAQIFSGTPRQPGTWQVTVTLWVACTSGLDTTPYQRQVPLTFTIEP